MCIYLIGFSLQNWLSSKGDSEVSGSLPEYVQYMLLEDRGISNMMKETPCSRTLVPWDNSTNIGIGWTSSMFYIQNRRGFCKFLISFAGL